MVRWTKASSMVLPNRFGRIALPSRVKFQIRVRRNAVLVQFCQYRHTVSVAPSKFANNVPTFHRAPGRAEQSGHPGEIVFSCSSLFSKLSLGDGLVRSCKSRNRLKFQPPRQLLRSRSEFATILVRQSPKQMRQQWASEVISAFSLS